MINERLAVEAGLQALRDLRRLGAPEDVFGRAATNRQMSPLPAGPLLFDTDIYILPPPKRH